jgi:hypothetical protein
VTKLNNFVGFSTEMEFFIYLLIPIDFFYFQQKKQFNFKLFSKIQLILQTKLNFQHFLLSFKLFVDKTEINKLINSEINMSKAYLFQ